MKKALKGAVTAALLATATAAHATPSTVVWTPATTYTQPFLVPHITYDTYFGERNFLQETVGLTVGFIPENKWVEGEVGADMLYPVFGTPPKDPTAPDAHVKYEGKSAPLVNAKVSLKEGALAAWSPGLSAGVYGVGFTQDVTNYNVFHAEIGKTLGDYGTVAVGYYSGNDKLLLKFSEDGTTSKDASGFMASYTSPKFNLGYTGLKDIGFAIDYQSAENPFGALGAAVTFFFTDAISILTGPVYFNNKYSAASVNLSATGAGTANPLYWTVQLDVDIDFARAKK